MTAGTVYPETDSVKSEIIDLENLDSICDDYLADLGRTDGVVGGLLYGDTPFICGGNFGQGFKCYIFGNSTVQTSLSTNRFGSAALSINETMLFITGGSYPDATTTELISPGQGSVRGPDLPADFENHCMVRLDEDTIMLLGSFYYPGDDTYFFSTKDDSFTKGPKLTGPKRSMMCGVFEDQIGNKLVVVAGGFHYGGLDEIEIFAPESQELFVVGGYLPKELSHGAAVVTSDKKSLIVIGGHDGSNHQDSLYKLTCTSEQCHVETMPQKLKVARKQHVALMIPDSLANCKGFQQDQ